MHWRPLARESDNLRRPDPPFNPRKLPTRRRLPSMRRLLHPLLLLALALPLAACRETAGAFGATPTAAARGADLFFGGLTARFVSIERSPKTARARRALVRAALVPSRVYDDTSVWTARPGPMRSLLVAGRPTYRGYYLWEDPVAPRPTGPGETWHYMNLTRLSDGLFRWNTGVDFAVGPVGAESVADIFGAMVGGAEGQDEARVRASYRVAFPRTTAALGLLASLDTLRIANLPDGSTSQQLVARVNPERLRGRYPYLARYLEKYVSSGKARLALRDRSGATWMTLDARDEVLRIAVRSRGARLAPLAGPVRPMPDTMALEADMSMKVKLFTVGFTGLVTELVVDERPAYRAWTVHARREPEWHLPLITERLLRTPLRRPFMGRGAMLRLGIREERGTTLLVRSAELVVEESAILRFLNSLAGNVLDDFDPRTEREQHAYLREIFQAMRADVRALAE